jgi:hypothetical protein
VLDPRLSLLVSLDGPDPETVGFCNDWEVPLIYSEQPEGVGISKNRVLERYPDFDYYFFVEDDVELMDDTVFKVHIEISRTSGIHHFSLFERDGIRKPISISIVTGHRIVHALFGGADFNFFTGQGLKVVGGWHPLFATFRFGGHTEHSYRFYRAGLAPAPFNVAQDMTDACFWHAPPSVTPRHDVTLGPDQLLPDEQALIDDELRFVAPQTLSAYRVNDITFAPPRRLAATLEGGQRYPLVAHGERRQCRSGYHLGRYHNAATRPRRAHALLAAAWNWPSNPELRHVVKTRLGR